MPQKYCYKLFKNRIHLQNKKKNKIKISRSPKLASYSFTPYIFVYKDTHIQTTDDILSDWFIVA